MGKEKDMAEFNSYEDAARAEAYARLEFPGTYYLAYRDLPELIGLHVKGNKAIDFGCGTGRSTRFLRNLGFNAVGVDISDKMIEKALDADPKGKYYHIDDEGLGRFEKKSWDLVLSAFTFDNIPGMDRKVKLLNQLAGLLNDDGIIINLVSSPEIYLHEWASFSTKDFPENRMAKAGDVVRIIITDIDDERPVEDIVWPDENYQQVYRASGLKALETRHPLGDENDGYVWVNETRIAPWVIYVLGRVID